eukprot:1270300-Heterocapsa_arctica.AAC.1
MDWIIRANYDADPDPDLWENLRLGKNVVAWENRRRDQDLLENLGDPDGDIDMGWDYYHNDPERNEWEPSRRKSAGTQIQTRRVNRRGIRLYLFLPS